MKRYFLRALKDIADNRFLTSVTVVTISLSILIAAAFALFFINAGDMLNLWKNGIRVMVYLQEGTSEAARLDTKFRLQKNCRRDGNEFYFKNPRQWKNSSSKWTITPH